MASFSSDPASVAAFRERTHNARPSMNFSTFKCKRCKEVRPSNGRKRVSNNMKDGWICTLCDEIRQEKIRAKAQADMLALEKK